MSAEAFLDPRFAALPRLVRELSNRIPAEADVRRFMSMLLEADPALFAGALLFRSRESRQGFVLLHEMGDAQSAKRGWLRWPLQRLFAARRASLITNPATDHRGLATPFSVGADLYVVVAPLRETPLNPAQRVLLDTLQNIGTASPELDIVAGGIPRFVWYGANREVAAMLEGISRTRGWESYVAPTLGHVLMLLERDACDVVVVDGAVLADPRSTLRALRHTARISDVPLLYVARGEPDSEIETLVDAWIDPSIGKAELLKILKRGISAIGRVRRASLRREVRKVEARLQACTGYTQLARECMHAAMSLGCSIVSVMLVDDMGRVHAAKRPHGVDRVLERLPIAFITGETLMRTVVDAGFFKDVFNDSSDHESVPSGSVSGVSIPIRDGEVIAGTLLGLSTGRPLFEPEFAALNDLCGMAGRALSAIRAGAQVQAVPHEDAQQWWRVRRGDLRIDLYEGSSADAVFRAAAYDDAGIAAIVTVAAEEKLTARRVAEAALEEVLACGESGEEAALSAILQRFEGEVSGLLLASFAGESALRFACSRFPVPLQIAASGPVPALRYANVRSSGSIATGSDSVTLICSSGFMEQIETAKLVEIVQRNLQDGSANPLHDVPSIVGDAESLAFAAVTMRSSGVASAPTPALL